MFLYPYDLLLLLESRHMQTWRLHHMTKAYVCLLSLDQLVTFIMCGTIALSVSSYCVFVVSTEQGILFAMCLSLGYLWQACLLPRS